MTSSFSSLVDLAMSGLNLGVLGIVFYLFLNGRLHSHSEVETMRDDLLAERAANDKLQQALQLADQRASSAMLNSEIIARALGGGSK
jgi:hypothetical protein